MEHVIPTNVMIEIMSVIKAFVSINDIDFISIH